MNNTCDHSTKCTCCGKLTSCGKLGVYAGMKHDDIFSHYHDTPTYRCVEHYPFEDSDKYVWYRMIEPNG